MPRKSVAALAVVPVGRATPRLAPPVGLDGAPAAVFREIVASVDAGHFKAGDARLVAQYAEAIVLGELAATHLRTEGVVVSGKASPWLYVVEKCWKSAATLAGKLRLCPAARYDARAASRRSDRPGPVDLETALEGLGDDE
jgi:hypothetical protein